MPQASKTTTVPGDVALRAAAILFIVFNHAVPDVPFWNWKGGMTVLMMVMGFNLARFGLKDADPPHARRAILDLLWRMFLPAFGYTIFYLALYRSLNWKELLFIANWYTPYHLQIFPVWYSQVILQLMAGLYLLFSIPPAARTILRYPLASMFALFTAGVLLRLLVPLVWDTKYLFQQVPHNFVWNFALGALVYFLGFESNRVPFAKLAAIALVVAGAAVGYGPGRMDFYALVISGAFLVGVREVRLPWVAAQTVVVISSAAYAIFLMHVVWMKIFYLAYVRIAGPGAWPSIFYGISFAFAVVMSVGCWLVFKSFVRALQSLHIAQPRLGLAR